MAGAVLAAHLGMALLGCTPTAVPEQATISVVPTELLPAAEDSRVEVPAADFDDPASVAEAFYTAWLSYDATVDTLESRRVRARPYVTAALATEGYSGNRLPAAEWQRAQAAKEWMQMVTPRAFIEPYAPSPTSTQAHYMVTATARTTTADGTSEAPAQPYPLVLVRVEGRWLVDRIGYH